MGNPVFHLFSARSRVGRGLLVLAVLAASAYAARAAQDRCPSGLLGATAPVMIAATEVSTLPADPAAPTTTAPTTSTVPMATAPGLATQQEAPLPELPGGPSTSGVNPTASGTTLMTGGAAIPDGKGAVDLGTARRFQYHFALSLIGTYDDNIFLDRHNKRDDFLVVIQPSVGVGFGDIDGHTENYIRFDYTPSVFLYTHFDDQDTVQHLLRLDAQYRFSKLTLNLVQAVQILDGADLTSLDSAGTQTASANVDVSGRTEVNLYTTDLQASYVLSEKSSVQLGLLYQNNDYESLLDSEVISSSFYYNYVYNPKLTLGVGLNGGYVLADNPTPDQSFEQLNFRATYVLTEKLSFIGTIGVEGRQSSGTDDEEVNPVFEFSALYQPRDGTQITFGADRRVESSALVGGADYVSTGFTLGFQQRFLTRFAFVLSGGYENEHYISIRDGFGTTRDDNYYFVQAGVDVTLKDHFSAGISYQHRQNFSSGRSTYLLDSEGNNIGNGNSSFSDNQISFRLSYRF